jgi:hypothetical protein
LGLYGIHKIGKSSLLNRVCQSLAAYSPDITIITIELSVAFSTCTSLYKRIIESLPQEVAIPHGDISTSNFREKLLEYQKQMQSIRPGHRLLIIIDECAYLIPDRFERNGLTDFLELLGFLKSFRQEVDWFNFLLCGRSPAISRTTRWKQGENPLIGFIKEIFLGPLTHVETEELVKSLGLIARLNFSDNAIDYIYSYTGGHPLFTRLLGSKITSILNQGVVSIQVIDEAVNSYLNNHSERALLLKIYEESLDNDEKEIVRKLTLGKEMKRSQLLEKYSDDKIKRRMRDAANNLIDTTVIIQDERKVLRIRYELLRRAIEQEIRELG